MGAILAPSQVLTLNRIRPRSWSGLGKPDTPAIGSVIKRSPKQSLMIAAMRSCCSTEQCVSADMITGYGEVTNAYFMIAWQMSRTDTLDVSVFL